MYIIETRIKEAFEKYKKGNGLLTFIRTIANVADYSVHSQGNAMIMYDAIKKYCPPTIFECVYYDGEEGVYRLLDFDPNGLDNGALLLKVRSCLVRDCYIYPDGMEKAMKNVYLLNTNALKKVR